MSDGHPETTRPVQTQHGAHQVGTTPASELKPPSSGPPHGESAAQHEPSWCEEILRLRAGENAPKGYEIKRLLGTFQQPTGAGANYVDVYVVACRRTG